MEQEKLQMAEAAVLYYEKKHTQQEIAQLMGLSRQTVSKLLNDALRENVVEIYIHDPKKDCTELEQKLCERFGIPVACVCSVSCSNNVTRQIMTVRAAASYLVPLLEQGNLKIAVSWGRTIREFIQQIPSTPTLNNLVFPLFGATDQDDSCFSSNEMARVLSKKIHSQFRPIWLPYRTDDHQDRLLLEKTSYFKKIQSLWDDIDIALVGIGNTEIIKKFGETFGYSFAQTNIVGDISTHFFDGSGTLQQLRSNTMCASVDNLRNAKKVIAIACGDDKVDAIAGALKTGLVHTLITDEHTAKQLLELLTLKFP